MIINEVQVVWIPDWNSNSPIQYQLSRHLFWVVLGLFKLTNCLEKLFWTNASSGRQSIDKQNVVIIRQADIASTYDLWHRAGLKFTELNQKRAIEEFQMWRRWQLEELPEDRLKEKYINTYSIVQWI